MNSSAGPEGRGRRSLEWIALDGAAHLVIARFTLEALAALVDATPDDLVRCFRHGDSRQRLELPLGEIDGLLAIGEVAALTPLPGKTVAVARIGRTSLVGFSRPEVAAQLIVPVDVLVTGS